MLLPLAGLLSCVPACHAAHVTAQTVSYEDLPCILRPVLPHPGCRWRSQIKVAAGLAPLTGVDRVPSPSPHTVFLLCENVRGPSS